MKLEINNLQKHYGKKKALDGVTLQIQPGEIVGLLGPNGSGKSTLIKAITDLITPDEGAVLFDELPLTPALKNDIAYLPDHSALDPAMKVKNAIVFYSDFYPGFDADKAQKLAEKMELPLEHEIKSMSKGMQEKLQLILTMSRKAKLYILDEPLGGVDPTSRDEILDTILSNFDEDASLLISTHLVHDVERILDRVVFLKNGSILADNPAEDLRFVHNCSIEDYYKEVMA